MARKHHRLNRKERRRKHRVTLRTLFLLSVTLIFNTYAWFLYATTVSTNLTAHVDAWRVEFEVDEEMVEREFNFVITHAYPGMQDRVQTVDIRNSGERPADITYMVKYIRIFDDEYYSSEYVQELGSTPQGATVQTAAQLLSKLQNDFPFQITVQTAQATLQTGQSSSISIRFGWAYETGDDETDTDYGTRAYEYYEDNNGEPVIQAIIRITVIQHQDQPITPATS
ncbi:MAG: hypothetical protein IKP28_05615 [Clostridia bacterium]|nr:hypothetical protein [Clostridia bacterium]